MSTRVDGQGVRAFGWIRATLVLGLAATLGLWAQPVGLGGPGKGASPKLTCGLEAVPGRLVAARATKGVAGGGAAQADVAAASLLPLRGNCIAIDAIAVGDVRRLRAELVALGLRNATVSGRMVSGLLPADKVALLANLRSLKFARPAYCTTQAGAVTSQGDVAQYSDLARSFSGVDGTGVTVGVLSDSFDDLGGAAADVASGDLPAGSAVLADLGGGGTDEGRAMMQIVHDVAPGAALQFHTAFAGQADFAQGIRDLVDNGCDVIVDDVFYYAEAMFQDDNVAQATDYAKANGVVYFSSAGNQARQSYEAPYQESGAGSHDFDPGPGVDDLLDITVSPGTVYFVLQWDDPFFSISGAPGAATDLDLYLYQGGGPTGIQSIAGNIGGDPVEIFGVVVSGGPLALQLYVERWTGPVPGRVKIVWYGSADVTVNEYATNSSTVCGHANAAGAEAVGAARYSMTPAFGVTPPVLEDFSSAGATPILFDTAGNRLGSPEIRVKPGIVAPDGGNNTFFGGDYEPDGWPNFFGTSAAAPHAAGVAALMLEVNSQLSPDQIWSIQRATAMDMDVAGFDNDTGYGLIQADAAVAATPQPPPLPDLVVPVLSHASPVLVARYLSAGQVYVRCQQANQGSLASRSCVLRFWLSADATLSKGSDRFLALAPVRSLAPGQTTPLANTLLRLGQRLAPGQTVYIIAEVDADGVVTESSETNNTAVLMVVGI